MKISGHGRRGRRGRGLPGDRAARTRARPDRAVARVRPPGAGQRLLLHARHLGPRHRPARARSRPTTTTPSRRGRASESSPLSSPRRRGRATPSRSPATCAARSNGPPTRADRGGQALAAAAQARAERAARRRSTTTPTARATCSRCAASLTAGSRSEYAAALAGRSALCAARTPSSGQSSCCSSDWPALGDRRRAERAASASCWPGFASGERRGASLGARGAARALRGAVPRRSRRPEAPACSLSSSRAARPGRSPTGRNLAVAALSSNSIVQRPPSPRTSRRRPSSARDSTTARSKPPPKWQMRAGAPTRGNGREGPSTARC